MLDSVMINGKNVEFDTKDFNIFRYDEKNTFLVYVGSGYNLKNPINNTMCYHMFYLCSGFLDLSKFDTSNVKNMKAMFYHTLLEKLNVSHLDTSHVKNMSCMFSTCEFLKELDLSNFDTSKVYNMNKMFFGCSKLQKLNVSNFNILKVEDMEEMFSGCKSLDKLDLTSFDFSNSPKVKNMFLNCICKVYVKDEWTKNYLITNTGYKNIFVKGNSDLRCYEVFDKEKPGVVKKINALNPKNALCKVICVEERDVKILKSDFLSARYHVKGVGNKRNTNTYYDVVKK